MKKLLIIILSAGLLCSCSNKAEEKITSSAKTSNTVTYSELTEETTEPPAVTVSEPAIALPDIFHIDFDFNLNPAEYENRIPIKYGSGSKKLIIYVNPEIGKNPVYGWEQTNHSISYLTMLSCENTEEPQKLNVIFSVDYILPAEYYIEYSFDIPEEQGSLVLTFDEYIYGSSSIVHEYSLVFIYDDDSIRFDEFKVEESGEISLWLRGNELSPWLEGGEIYSPSGKTAIIGGWSGTDYWVQGLYIDNKQIVVNNENIDEMFPNSGIKNAVWLDDDILLVIYGYAHGTVTKGGDIWYYDTRNGSNGLIINRKSNIEMNNLNFDDDKLVFDVYCHFYGAQNVFYKKYEKPVSKNQIYDLINFGEVMTIDTEPIPEPGSIYDYSST